MKRKKFNFFAGCSVLSSIILIVKSFSLSDSDLKGLLMNIGSGILTTLLFIVCYDEVNSREKTELNIKYKRVALVSLKSILIRHLEFLCCLSGREFFDNVKNNSIDFNDLFTDEYYDNVDKIDLSNPISLPIDNSLEYKTIYSCSGIEYVRMQNKETLDRFEKLFYKYGVYIPAEILEEYEKITMSKYIQYETLYNVSRTDFLKNNIRIVNSINSFNKEFGIEEDENLCVKYIPRWKLSIALREHVPSILHILNVYNENVMENDKIYLTNIENNLVWGPIIE